eukprot:gene9972-2148_t
MAKAMMHACAAIARRQYFHESISDVEIREALPGEEDIETLLQTASVLVDRAIRENLDLSEVSRFFEANENVSVLVVFRIYSIDPRISEEHKTGFGKFWKAYKPKLSHELGKQTAWNPQLSVFNWRVDVTTQTDSGEEQHQPVGIFDIALDTG